MSLLWFLRRPLTLNRCAVSDFNPFPAEKTEDGRDSGRPPQEGGDRVRSSHGQAGPVLHRRGQQDHRQDARSGEGSDCDAVVVVFIALNCCESGETRQIPAVIILGLKNVLYEVWCRFSPLLGQ